MDKLYITLCNNMGESHSITVIKNKQTKICIQINNISTVVEKCFGRNKLRIVMIITRGRIGKVLL